MRVAYIAVALILTTSACGDAAEGGAPEPTTPSLLPAPEKTPAGPAPTAPTAPVEPREDAVLNEVVYVLSRNEDTQWFCTGALVAEDVVVTAAHCIDTSRVSDFEVVAPLAPGKPRVRASHGHSFDGDYDDPRYPDIGILQLDQPITLPAYAELTDISARVDRGERLTGVAVVRTAEEPEAPLHLSKTLPVSSTVSLGYRHGIGTPMFSRGGDSGAGLFLVENGKRTHKLIGVARQPEPDRNLDHFTRIDPPIRAWFREVAPVE